MTVLQKNKKLAAGIGVAAAAAAVLAVGAGTYASFTDTEALPNTTFAAGSLNLEIGGTITAEPFKYADLKPGDVRNETLTIDNTGTIDGKLTFTFSVSGAEGSCVEPETDVEKPCDNGSELTEALLVSVAGQKAVPLSQVGTSFGPQNLPATGGPITVPIQVTVDKNAGNDIMTDSTVVTLSATLVQ